MKTFLLVLRVNSAQKTHEGNMSYATDNGKFTEADVIQSKKLYAGELNLLGIPVLWQNVILCNIMALDE